MPARKPLAVIMGNGNTSHLTKEEILQREQQEIKAPSDNIKIPKYLTDKKLKTEFKRLSKELVNINLMSNLDCDALARFLIAQNEYVRVTEEINKTQLMIENEETGELEVNNSYERLVIVHDKFFKQARAAATDLGLTISSRCKLVLPKTEKENNNEEDAFDSLFKIK